jgi:hypothetical protein
MARGGILGSIGALGILLVVLDRFTPKRRPPAPVGTLAFDGEQPTADAGEQLRVHTVRTIDDRVKLIRELVKVGGVNPQIRSLAHSFLNRRCGESWCVPEKDQKAEVVALFNEVRRRVRYTNDPLRRDTYTEPSKTVFAHKGGDCDDSAAALGALLESVGYAVRLRVVQTKGYDSWNHIYLVAKLSSTGEWVALDPTMNKPAGWEVPDALVIKKRDFDV